MALGYEEGPGYWDRHHADRATAVSRAYMRERNAAMDARLRGEPVQEAQPQPEAPAEPQVFPLPETPAPDPMQFIRENVPEQTPVAKYGQTPTRESLGSDLAAAPLHGVIKGAAETSSALTRAGHWVMRETPLLDQLVSDTPPEWTQETAKRAVRQLGLAAPKGMAAETVSAIFQLALPTAMLWPVGGAAAAGVGKAMGAVAKAAPKTASALTKSGQVVTGGTQVGVSVSLGDALAFDPDEHSGALRVIANEFPLLEPVIADMFLAPDPDTPEFQRRVFMALEGAVIGAAAGVTVEFGKIVFKGLARAAKVRQEGTKLGAAPPAEKEAVRAEADETAAKVAEEVEKEVEDLTTPTVEQVAGLATIPRDPGMAMSKLYGLLTKDVAAEAEKLRTLKENPEMIRSLSDKELADYGLTPRQILELNKGEPISDDMLAQVEVSLGDAVKEFEASAKLLADDPAKILAQYDDAILQTEGLSEKQIQWARRDKALGGGSPLEKAEREISLLRLSQSMGHRPSQGRILDLERQIKQLRLVEKPRSDAAEKLHRLEMRKSLLDDPDDEFYETDMAAIERQMGPLREQVAKEEAEAAKAKRKGAKPKALPRMGKMNVLRPRSAENVIQGTGNELAPTAQLSQWLHEMLGVTALDRADGLTPAAAAMKADLDKLPSLSRGNPLEDDTFQVGMQRVANRVAILRGAVRMRAAELEGGIPDALIKAERDMVDAHAWLSTWVTPERTGRLIETTGAYTRMAAGLLRKSSRAPVLGTKIDDEILSEWTQGLRNAQRQAPYFNDERAMMADAPVTGRLEPVSEAAKRRPMDADLAAGKIPGMTTEEAARAANTPSIQPGLELPSTVAKWLPSYDRAVAQDQPMDVWFRRLTTPQDFEDAEAAVATIRGLDFSKEQAAYEKAMEELQAANRALAPLIAEGKPIPVKTEAQRTRALQELDLLKPVLAQRDVVLVEARKAVRRMTGLEGFGEAGEYVVAKGEAVGRMTANLQAVEDLRPVVEAKDQAVRQSRTGVQAMTGIQGYGMRVGPHSGEQWLPRKLGGHKLRGDVDFEVAAHTLDAMAGTIQRMARAATSPGAPARLRADTLSAMHKLSAYVEHLYGRDANVLALLSKASLPAGDKTLQLGVKRRVAGADLIAASGGSQRAAAYLSAIAKSKDTMHALHTIGQWANESARGKVFARGGHQTGWRQRHSVMAGYASGLLSAPATIVRNTLGTIIHGSWRGGPEKWLSRMMTDGPVTGTKIATREIGASIGAAYTGMLEGFKLGAALARRQARMVTQTEHEKILDEHGWTTLASEFQKTTRLDIDESVALQGLPQGLLDAAQGTPWQKTANALSSAISGVYSLGLKGTFYSDVIARVAGYRAHMASRLARDTFGESLSPEEMTLRMVALHADEAVRREALDNAQQNAFLNAADDLPTQIILELKQKYPEMSVAVPFVNTLSNITKEKLRRIPGVGLAVDKWDAKRAGRDLTKQDYADAAARQTITLLTAAAAAYAMNQGHITGSMAGRPRERSAAFKAGWQPYSIRIQSDDGKIAYLPIKDVLGPVNIGPVIGITVKEWFDSLDFDDAEQIDEGLVLVDMMAKAAADVVLDETWAPGLLGVQGALAALVDGDTRALQRSMAALGDWAPEFGANVIVPSSSLTRRFERARHGGASVEHERSGGAGGKDETLAESAEEALMEMLHRMREMTAGNLGMTEGSFPRINEFTGEPYRSLVPEAPEEAGFAAGFYTMAGPLALSYQTDSAAAREGLEIGWAPSRPVRRRGEDVQGEVGGAIRVYWEMGPELFHAYSVERGKIFRQISDKGIDSARWRKLAAVDKRARLNDWVRIADTEAWARVSQQKRFEIEVEKGRVWAGQQALRLWQQEKEEAGNGS